MRILDERKGTGAVTRVLLDAGDGIESWGAIGVSENVIEACWEALVDSLEAGMLPGRAEHVRPLARERTPSSDPAGPPGPGRARGGAGPGDAALRAAVAGPAAGRVRAGLRGASSASSTPSAVSSGTAGLHLAIRLAGVEAGDEVVTSPFSFVASANVMLYERARPVFVDIDPVTLNIAPEAAAAAVTDRTTGLLPVHIFGYPADMPGFERLAADRGLWLVEDTCEALGAVHADGTLGGRARQPQRCSPSTRTSS